MTNSAMLEKLIHDSGLMKRSIMERLGFKSYATLRAKIANENEFTASEIDKLSDILRLSNDQREAVFFAKAAE